MKVAGFTFVKNAVKFDYPIVESINSILPLVDAFYIAHGDSSDNTEELLRSINSNKIKIINTVWDAQLREGGKVLAEETNKAFDCIPLTFDWCFYLQADEVVHEKYLEEIKHAMQLHLNNKKIEGLLFNYKHFFGSYDYYGDSRKWYRHEVRIIRNIKNIRSYKDAQGFRIGDRKLNVALINAFIYHYGWVKNPRTQQQKQENFHKLWHSDNWVEANTKIADEFNYHKIDSLARFMDTHPKVMESKIKLATWPFNPDLKKKNYKFKYRILKWIEDYSGLRIGEFKNYKRIL